MGSIWTAEDEALDDDARALDATLVAVEARGDREQPAGLEAEVARRGFLLRGLSHERMALFPEGLLFLPLLISCLWQMPCVM